MGRWGVCRGCLGDGWEGGRGGGGGDKGMALVMSGEA